MAENFNADDLPAEKPARYQEITNQLAAVIDGEDNLVARCASAVCLLVGAFAPRFFWTGFYLVDEKKPSELVVGPYQGTLGCLRIGMGRGVCGTAAGRRETVLVKNVHEFPGHIACDARSQSEIVVPLLGANGALLGVLDVDSSELAAFNEDDQAGLEAITRLIGSAY